VVIRGNAWSEGKSFGKVLGYLAAEVAVVASRAIDHPLFFEHGRNGLMAETQEQWVEAVGTLLDDPDRRQKLAEAAYGDLLRELSSSAAAQKLDKVLRCALAGQPLTTRLQLLGTAPHMACAGAINPPA